MLTSQLIRWEGAEQNNPAQGWSSKTHGVCVCVLVGEVRCVSNTVTQDFLCLITHAGYLIKRLQDSLVWERLVQVNDSFQVTTPSR